jgi:hypothetical protein
LPEPTDPKALSVLVPVPKLYKAPDVLDPLPATMEDPLPVLCAYQSVIVELSVHVALAEVINVLKSCEYEPAVVIFTCAFVNDDARTTIARTATNAMMCFIVVFLLPKKFLEIVY